MEIDRRTFMAASAGAALAGHSAPRSVCAAAPRLPSDGPGIGVIGLRYQGSVIADKARAHGRIVALADVDRHVLEQARASFGSTPAIFEDYRGLLDRKDVQVVLIGAPDHWHVKMAVDACRAGKDVYVEKPLSLTIDEGKLMRRVARQTGRVVQVGSWQRSDARYRLAVEMVRAGRIGKLRKVTCATGPNPVGGPFAAAAVPKHLNWDLWQGQAEQRPYAAERCHYTFRWWYEYAGGKITDWGAHDLDVAQWAIGENPQRVVGSGVLPTTPNAYNVPTEFEAVVHYPGGVELHVSEQGRAGVLFEGDQGRIFVNRGTLQGAPVEALADDPLPREQFALYDFDNRQRPERSGKLDAIVNHMGNFFDCIAARRDAISDVESQHRSATTCHLVNLSIRLGRPVQWDAAAEQIVGDDEANLMLARKQRKGFEVI